MSFVNVVRPTDTRPLSQYTKTNKPVRTGFGQFMSTVENGVSSPLSPPRKGLTLMMKNVRWSETISQPRHGSVSVPVSRVSCYSVSLAALRPPTSFRGAYGRHMRCTLDDRGSEAESVYGRGDEWEILCTDPRREREVLGEPCGCGSMCDDFGCEVKSVSDKLDAIPLRRTAKETVN